MAVLIESTETYFLIRPQGPRLNPADGKNLVDLIASTKGPGLIILDFSSVEDLYDQGFNLISNLSNRFKDEGVRLELVGNPVLEKIIQDKALSRVLFCRKSLKEVLPESAYGGVQGHSSTSNADVLKFLNVVLDGVKEVFSVAASTQVTVESVKVLGQNKYVADVCGTVGLVSKVFHGTLVLGFTMETYIQIMTRMLGEPVTELTPEVRDGAAELLNMIFGNAKTKVSEFELQSAIPTIFVARGIQVQGAGNKPSIVVHFNSDVGSIYAELIAISK